MPLHLFTKVRIRYTYNDYTGTDDVDVSVWGHVLTVPEGARQVSPSVWRLDADTDGRPTEYHGPFPVPGT